ncbi:MAG: GntR family transcriptional regulator [Devosia sp.]|uniref:GntR family transcriptional regulator n=1 Tax=Devosia sp. TaxID=1871048 RepID=UPI00260339F0|nr:GntR family transcriptional regulator [Devosia sp.]MDB5527354.1 GntR family transcriptional regulator [Devosia sp.]
MAAKTAMGRYEQGAVTPPLNEPTYLRVKRAIIHDLVSRAITPGQRLTIEELTTRYQVSHMPIREALRQLEGEGILKSLAHRGFRVEPMTEDYVRNIYDIRVGVESMLGRRAAERVTDADLVALEEIQTRYEHFVLANQPSEAVQVNIAFHARLYSIAGNPEAQQLLEGRTRLVWSVADSLDRYSPYDRQQIIPEHRRILTTLAARQPTECGQAVFDHVTNARDRLLHRLRNAEPPSEDI